MRQLTLMVLAAFALVGCKKADADGDTIGDLVPDLLEFRQVVPGPGLPPEVVPMDANNNLDVEWYDGRLYFAFRTAPDHFASTETTLHVVSSTDEQTWRYEGSFSMGTDLREPQLVSWNGQLHFYFAVLGDNPLAFEPQGSRHTVYNGPGDWEPVAEIFPDDFIPWRIKPVEGRLSVTGYTGGGGVYDPATSEPIRVRWMASDNGVDWTPWVAGTEVVYEGGGSESDLVVRDDGSVVAVIRNEAGDEGGFGSKVCTATAKNPADWTCDDDPRKYDSPLMFEREGKIWLIGRKTMTEDGLYDLGRDDLTLAEKYLFYQLTYWQAPKRCALWEVDPQTRTVHWILDLPSKGDTCFPEAVELGDDLLVYNYSSDPEGPDVSWVEGQKGLTGIYRQILDFTP